MIYLCRKLYRGDSMAYTVRYTQPGSMERNKIPASEGRRKILIAVLLAVLMLFGTGRLLSDSKVQELLIPGDPAVTKQAFTEMTQSIRDGQPVDDAIVAFCRQIIAFAGA